MVRNTLKILQQMLQDFQSVSYHFGTLCIKVLMHILILALRPHKDNLLSKVKIFLVIKCVFNTFLLLRR